jgi:hypothetical protein
MTHSPASASGDPPPAEAGLTAQDLTARLKAEGELTADEIIALARLDDGPGAGGGSSDYGPEVDAEPPMRRVTPPVAEVWDAGFIHGVPGEPGYGFESGGLVDRMLPGRELAAFTGTALGGGLGRLSDDELIGFLCAARRNVSWQQAAELAAVADLDQRRAGADGAPGGQIADEVAAALTMTARAAEGLLALAAGVMRLSQVPAALAAGVIDRSRAEVFVRELLPLGDEGGGAGRGDGDAGRARHGDRAAGVRAAAGRRGGGPGSCGTAHEAGGAGRPGRGVDRAGPRHRRCGRTRPARP